MNSTSTEKPITTTSTAEEINPINSDDEVVVITKTLLKATLSNSESDQESIEDDDEPIDFPPKFTCKICETPKPIHETFRVKGCDHYYCSNCIAEHVSSKIKDSVTKVKCPFSGCNGELQPENCREILAPEVYDRWGYMLCEGAILGCHRFNCPFEDCVALLINDGEVVREAECPYCFRLFCAQCKVPWHSHIDCATFQMRN